MADESWLTERIGEAIRECLEQGFELPVYAAIIASNGACAFFRFVDEGDDESVVPELMAQHPAEPGMVPPNSRSVIRSWLVKPGGLEPPTS